MAGDAKRSTVTVEQFLELARDPLGLELEAGEKDLSNPIEERSMNRPGLIFAGFNQYFAQRRIQVVGLAELTYLKSLDVATRRTRLENFFSRGLPCVIITRNRKPLKEILEYAKQYQVPLLRSPMITMDLISQATILLDDLMSPRTRLHGSMIDIQGIGVLIEGEPGIGKSETALALIARGHSLVSDDVTVLRISGADTLVATAVPITRHHMEIRGLGIIHVPSLFGVSSMRDAKKLDMVVRLVGAECMGSTDRTGMSSRTKEILGIPIPYYEVPVGAGRDMAPVVEVAALNHRLKQLGHDAAKELDEKLVNLLSRKVVCE